MYSGHFNNKLGYCFTWRGFDGCPVVVPIDRNFCQTELNITVNYTVIYIYIYIYTHTLVPVCISH